MEEIMFKHSLAPRILLIGSILILASLSCQSGSLTGSKPTTYPELPPASAVPPTSIPAVMPTALVEPTVPTISTEAAQVTSPPAEPTVAAETPAVNQPQTCEQETCMLEGSFLLKRPIGSEGRNTIVYTNRYGEYQSSTKQASRGVTFLNSTGTPVLAAADGTVVVAGDDSQTPYGPFRDLYGNLVILEHQLPGYSEPFFTVYGHLSEIGVEQGQSVKSGDEIGKVGMSGNATGSSLLFEVRMGENSYNATRNPELWLENLPDEAGTLQGVIAGRILDQNGKPVKADNIVLERLAGAGLPAIDTFYLKTYGGEALSGLEPWGENFAAGDLPAGDYQITFYVEGKLQQRVVTVEPGKLTLVTFKIPDG